MIHSRRDAFRLLGAGALGGKVPHAFVSASSGENWLRVLEKAKAV